MSDAPNRLMVEKLAEVRAAKGEQPPMTELLDRYRQRGEANRRMAAVKADDGAQCEERRYLAVAEAYERCAHELECMLLGCTWEELLRGS